MKKGNTNTVLIVIAVVVILGIAGLYLAHKKLSTNYQNTSNATISSGNSNADLDTDMNTIDGSINNANSASGNVNQAVNDTPIPQPQ